MLCDTRIIGAWPWGDVALGVAVAYAFLILSGTS